MYTVIELLFYAKLFVYNRGNQDSIPIDWSELLENNRSFPVSTTLVETTCI